MYTHKLIRFGQGVLKRTGVQSMKEICIRAGHLESADPGVWEEHRSSTTKFSPGAIISVHKAGSAGCNGPPTEDDDIYKVLLSSL